MEAIAGLSLAANIFQVVQFSADLVKTLNEIRKNGSTTRNQELINAATELYALSETLKKSCGPCDGGEGPLLENDQKFKDLARESCCIADTFLGMVSALKVDDKAGRRDMWQTAIKTMWKKSKIDETNAQLKDVRARLELRILVTVHSKVDLLVSQDYQALDGTIRTMIETILHDQNELRTAMSHHTEDAMSLQKEIHRRTISAIQKQSLPVNTDEVHWEILSRLEFRAMQDRHEEIKPRYKQTFDWILADAQMAERSPCNFVHWLRTGSGIYWISGKAGSGKSTLMKFLRDDPRTAEALAEWASGDNLMITSFYFWRAGTDLQRSQAGLFRSLLYEILRQYPDLGPLLLPRQYEPRANWDGFPTLIELKKAFTQLILQDVVKIVFFIDGLDEYEGTDACLSELADLFTAAVSSANIKAVLSSRPLDPFEAVFADVPKMRLHQLTRGDVTLYVRDQLHQHRRMTELTRHNEYVTERLVESIVTSASGVFLWVVLVVRSLLEGLRKHDTISMLQDRLYELPDDLDSLFEHMLRNIDPRYRAHSSLLFQLFRCYKIHVAERSIPTLIISYAAEAAGIVCPYKLDESERRCDEMKVHLRTRCAGLLEEQWLSVSESDQESPSYDEVNGKFFLGGSRINYSHRLVAEFLDRPSVWAGIAKATQWTDFDASIFLLKGHIRLLGIWRWDADNSGELLVELLRGVIYSARACEKTKRTQIVELLESFDSTMDTHFRGLLKAHADQTFVTDQMLHTDLAGMHWSINLSLLEMRKGQFLSWVHHIKKIGHYWQTFMYVAARAGLTTFLEEKTAELDAHDIIVDEKELLSAACGRYIFGNSEIVYLDSIRCSLPYIPSPSTVELFIRRGCDPNQIFRGFSPWEYVLRSIHGWQRWKTPWSYEGGERLWAATVKCLISYGANPHAFVDLEIYGEFDIDVVLTGAVTAEEAVSREEDDKSEEVESSEEDDNVEEGDSFEDDRSLDGENNHVFRCSAMFAIRRLFSRKLHHEISELFSEYMIPSPEVNDIFGEDSINELSSLLVERGAEEFLWHRVPAGGNEKKTWKQIFPPPSTLGEPLLRDESYFEWLRKGKPQSEASREPVQARFREEGQTQTREQEQTQSKKEGSIQPKEEVQAQLRAGRRRDKFKKLLLWKKKE